MPRRELKRALVTAERHATPEDIRSYRSASPEPDRRIDPWLRRRDDNRPDWIRKAAARPVIKAPAPVYNHRKASELAAIASFQARLEDYETNDKVYPERDREPKSIYSPAPAPRVRFERPRPRLGGSGRPNKPDAPIREIRATCQPGVGKLHKAMFVGMSVNVKI